MFTIYSQSFYHSSTSGTYHIPRGSSSSFLFSTLLKLNKRTVLYRRAGKHQGTKLEEVAGRSPRSRRWRTEQFTNWSSSTLLLDCWREGTWPSVGAKLVVEGWNTRRAVHCWGVQSSSPPRSFESQLLRRCRHELVVLTSSMLLLLTHLLPPHCRARMRSTRRGATRRVASNRRSLFGTKRKRRARKGRRSSSRRPRQQPTSPGSTTRPYFDTSRKFSAAG